MNNFYTNDDNRTATVTKFKKMNKEEIINELVNKISEDTYEEIIKSKINDIDPETEKDEQKFIFELENIDKYKEDSVFKTFKIIWPIWVWVWYLRT